MEMLLLGLSVVIGIGSLICFIMVLVAMFQNGANGLGIACAVLILCGIGPLIALIAGWINAKAWRIEKLMLIWTVLIVAGIILNIASFTMFGGVGAGLGG